MASLVLSEIRKTVDDRSMAVNVGVETARERGMLAGRRVLYAPKNSRTPYFQSFLAAARQRHGWHIVVVGPERHAPVWRNIADHVAATPDFTKAQAWENDREACERLDAFIWSCEQASGISAARIVLAGERDIGRGFSCGNYYWFHDKMARRVLADNAEPTRIVRRMFAFARDTLLASKPDLVMAGEWADSLCFAIYLAARQMGIPCIVNRPSKLWSGRCYWSADPRMYNDAAGAMVEDMRAKGTTISDRSRDRIASFRGNPNTLGYVQQNWNLLDRRGWLGEHVDLVRIMAARISHRVRGRGGPPPKPASRLLWDFYRRAFLRFRQGMLSRRFSEDELRDRRYILIALHKDPEQALNYQAPLWSNQYNTVALLSGALPDGFTLLVREHRNNRGRRPTRYYKDLLRLPGVVLIDGFDDQFKYLRNADLIVTENGSSGWEGLMLGRRVIALDESFYGAVGLARRVQEPEDIGAIVVEMLGSPPVKDAAAHDQNLGWMLDAEWQTTAPLDDPGYSRTLDLLDRILAAVAPRAAVPTAAIA